jgi:hypothetical protein
MVAAPDRIEAKPKRRGPSTPAGKVRSRANALKHGLCSMTIVTESEELIRERADAFIREFRAEGVYALWLANQAALASIRIERCQRMERAARDKTALRAELCWGDDRRLEVVKLGELIARRPESVVEKLRETPQGCDWLIGRWALLAHAANAGTGWTPEQSALALDLLGTPLEFREGLKPGATVNPGGRVVESVDEPAALARRMVGELVARRDLLAGIDEAGRALAMSDLDDEVNPEVKRLRRYEASLERRLRWCLDRLEDPSDPEGTAPAPDSKDARTLRDPGPPTPVPPAEPEPGPLPVPAREPLPVPRPSPGVEAIIAAGRFSNIDLPYGNRPFGLPTLADFVERPAPVDRAEQKLQKAEARREAKRRKREKLRS